jgi:glycosyltransferase involved in cell wall biosynthesis
MIRKLFYLFPIFGALIFGYWMGLHPVPKQETLLIKDDPHPEKEFPVTEEKSFAIVVHSYKNAKFCVRCLKSILEQEYDHFRILFFDDGSGDGTFEKVQSFVLENKQEHRVTLIQNSAKLGAVACLSKAGETLQAKEIAIPLDVKDWFAKRSVLSRLNAVYQNPDVWITLGGSLFYPSYERGSCKSWEGGISCQLPVSFYAALFKEVRLSDLMQEGRFVGGRDAYLEPLLKMAGGRIRLLEEPLFITNLARCFRQEVSKPLSSYDPLPEFPGSQANERKADIVIFSCDRPMQLFACLESIHRYFSGFERISVLTRASDERYLAGYELVREQFPEVRFVFQGKEYKKDFKPLLLKTLFQSPSEYVLFGTDDEIVKDFTDLNSCMEMMSKTRAYGFYLRLGSHITYSYQLARDQVVPRSIDLGGGVYAWNIKVGYSDWDFPNTLDMTLYRKGDLKAPFEKMNYKTPNSLEFCWAKEVHPEHEVGLYFEHSKVVNLPLNVVSRTGNPHMNFLQPPELLARFEQGLKIDIEPLYKVENNSPHFEYFPEFVLR